MKQIIFALLLILCMSSCKQQQRRKYISVLDNEKSLVNQWYGKDHFTENDQLNNASLNKNDKQDSFESEAGQMVINSTSTSSENKVQTSSSTTPSESTSTNSSSSETSSSNNTTSALTTDSVLQSGEEKLESCDKCVEAVSQQDDESVFSQNLEEETAKVLSKQTDQENQDLVENKDNEI
ncbi:MAG: hypothetical protein S4CHLAM6_01120 [Chlamydiae bacterium]|nr:hypothetical protein [Chlamydiota bacterium]